MDDANDSSRPGPPGEPHGDPGDSEPPGNRRWQSRDERIRLWIVTLTPIITTVSTVVITLLTR
ncbi:hypothetical protein NONI108955_05240 [Nocardia ninae]|uniref:Uncharacterized protein n=1 Tax=Nocardia ninae NBRC 108245 TaxID=1210091 RepID=A0A511MAA1_9NOCA|nr:hypothetical protein [Nocardia ninae]GEM37583.1 hypothetical protein NN4_21020 [Nocardia ninae NBRC 108245]